jgi:hypothetical protein
MKMQEPNWSELIREQKVSGSTIEDFCASRGLNKSTFKKRKYGVVKKAKVLANEFIELPRRASVLNIKLKNGRTLEISGGFSESDVQRLIRLLESC